MGYEERKELIKKIEQLRGRTLISFCNFDKLCIPEFFIGTSTMFNAECKESLFRVLKEAYKKDKGLDLYIYTRGGDLDAVWSIVSLIREFDPNFEVLIPFRAHSGGTLLSLSGKKIFMSRIAELSPIDPTTGNQFNPQDPLRPNNKLGISVEDVRAYEKYIEHALKIPDNENDNKLGDNKLGSYDNESRRTVQPFISHLLANVHPIAIGNVHRVSLQIKELAKMLLNCHPDTNRDDKKVIEQLTTKYYSHLHMICRKEAKDILGEKVEEPSSEMEDALDLLLRQYEDDFALRVPFILSKYLGDELSKDITFVGGVVEAANWGYKYLTTGILNQYSMIPNNIQLQIQPGLPVPLIPGMQRQYRIDLTQQGWVNNKSKIGVSI
jgi:hypothetical protein